MLFLSRAQGLGGVQGLGRVQGLGPGGFRFSTSVWDGRW